MEAIMEAKTEESQLDQMAAYKGDSQKFLTFILEDEEYGIEILKVREIIGMMPITPVPQSQHTLKGVINLRGKIIPVFDLRLIFGMGEKDYDSETCIIIVDVAGRLAGIVVDTVSEVMDVRDDDIETSSGLEAGFNSQFIMGISKVNDKIRILVDIDNILGDKELNF